MEDDEGSLVVDDEEEWISEKDHAEENKVVWKNKEFKKFLKEKGQLPDYATMLTSVIEREENAEDLVDFPPEDDENNDSDAIDSSDLEDEEDDDDREEEGEGNTDSEASGPAEDDKIQDDRDETLSDLSLAELSMVDDELLPDDRYAEEVPRLQGELRERGDAAGGQFNTPQDPRASFLSACSNNTSTSSEEFFSPGKKGKNNKRRAELETAAGKEDYVLVDLLICNACHARTNLPELYCNRGTRFLCNTCLKEESGHANCMKEGCQICQIVGKELGRRLMLETSFRNGSLVLEETISSAVDVTLPNSPASITSRLCQKTDTSQSYIIMN